MNRILLTLLLALSAGAAGAQSLVLRMGGGLASRTGGGHRPVGSYFIGLAYEYEFDQRFTFSPGLAFRGQGWRLADELVPMLGPDGKPVVGDDGEQRLGVMRRSATAGYLELPLLFNCYLRTSASRYVCLTFGPYAAVGVAGKFETKGDGQASGADKFYYSVPTFSSDGARRFDAGLEAGAAFHFNTGFSLGLDARFGLVPTAPGAGRNIAGVIALGYRFGR